MSKTPIRTALERLDSEGFVAISPQQGVLVRELSIEDIADLFEIRVALEMHVGARWRDDLTPRRVNNSVNTFDNKLKRRRPETLT